MKMRFLDPGPTGRRWPWRLAVAFILLTLLTLVAVPWLVQRRVSELRADIVASEPARTLTLAWQFNLVREMSALSELLLSGDNRQRRTYGAALQAERVIYDKLGPLANRLGPGVAERFAAARTLAEEWHTRVDDDDLLRQREEGIELLDIPREQRLFEDALRAVARLDSAIVASTAVTRAQIAAAERNGLVWTGILGVLMLLASVVVFALEARVRNYAAEAERQRADAAAALAETARASEARHRLLRGITHDVKNPLGAAKGYAELLAMEVKGPLEDEQKALVAGMERSIDSALAIITDLLDLARVDGGGVSVNRVETDLSRLAREAADDVRASARTTGHEIEAVPGDPPLIAHTDPARVRQILDNLLSNAIKYTPPPGRITVVTRTDGRNGEREGAWAVIEVTDTGPGIPVEHRETVFDEFSRLHEDSPIKGQGLGLAIARNLARRLGGDLTIADRGPGATFVLWLPLRD